MMEALRLRVKDVEFTRREIVIREGKGAQAGVTARAAPFIRYASAAIGLRHPHGARTARHADVSTTMIYTHVLNKGRRGAS